MLSKVTGTAAVDFFDWDPKGQCTFIIVDKGKCYNNNYNNNIINDNNNTFINCRDWRGPSDPVPVPRVRLLPPHQRVRGGRPRRGGPLRKRG